MKKAIFVSNNWNSNTLLNITENESNENKPHLEYNQMIVLSYN